LTGKYLDPSKAGPGDRLFDENLMSKTEDAGVKNKLHQLADLAASWGMALSQLTIAYMLTLPGMGPVIAGASTVEQLTLNAGAGLIHLEEEQLAQVRAVLHG
ncbi:MAG: aldo/keto reductase, partial [Chitinophagaceae bacterium]